MKALYGNFSERLSTFLLSSTGTVQGSISTTGLKDPLKYKAVGSNGKPLKINGQETLTVESPASTDPTTLVIHNDGKFRFEKRFRKFKFEKRFFP